MIDTQNINKSKEKPGKRTLAREQCFSVMFEMTFTEDSVEDILDNAVESRMLVPLEYAEQLLTKYSENKDYIDGLISENIKGWSMSRVSRTARSVLRTAVCEMEYTSTPVSVVINEAVEITKKYGTEKEASFVNGILGTIAKKKNAENQTDE